MNNLPSFDEGKNFPCVYELYIELFLSITSKRLASNDEFKLLNKKTPEDIKKISLNDPYRHRFNEDDSFL